MMSSIDSQALANRFNEEETVWRRYEQKRGFRQVRDSLSPLPEEVLSYLDWLKAERECRERLYVGKLAEEAIPTKAA